MTQGPRHPLALALPSLLLAGVLFTALDTTGKLLLQEHSLFVVVWARYVGQMLIVTAYARHRTGPHFWRTRHPRAQLARSALLVVTSGAFYVGLRYLPLAEATAIMFATPLLVVLLSGPVLGERATRGRVVAALAGFVGVLLLLRPGSAALHPAVVVVLGAALCNAFYQMLTTKVAGDGTNTSLFYSTVVGAVVLTLALPWGFAATTLSARDWVLLVAAGLFAAAGHGLMIRAFQLAPPSLLAPFTYVQMLWAVAFGYAVFGQLPDRWSALGMAIIVRSGVLLALLERRRARLGRSFP